MQRSSASPIVAVLLASLLGACADDVSGPTGAPSGEKVFAAQGCTLCHGSDATGSSFGPTLHGKARYWTREKLVQYLKAPVEYAEKDPRLAEQRKKYTMPMRQFDKVPDDELGAVADFVLQLP